MRIYTIIIINLHDELELLEMKVRLERLKLERDRRSRNDTRCDPLEH